MKTGTHQFEGEEDYTAFVEWVLQVTVENLDEDDKDDDTQIHIERIVLHYLKLLSLTYHHNEEYFFETKKRNANGVVTKEIEYSDLWVQPGPKRGQTPTKRPKESNLIFHNIIQHIELDIRQKCNSHGMALLLKSNRICGTVNVLDRNTATSDRRKLILSGYPSSIHDFKQVSGVFRSTNSNSYGCYSSNPGLSTPDNDNDGDESAVNNNYDLTQLMKFLPSKFSFHTKGREDGPPLHFADMEYKNSDKPSWSIRNVPKRQHDSMGFYEQGGGFFFRFLTSTLQVVHLMCVPFEFISIALQRGHEDIMPTRDKEPFLSLDHATFEKCNYPGFDLNGKGKVANFLNGGDNQIEENPLPHAFHEYLKHLVNAARKEQTPEEIRLDSDDKDMQQMSLGTFLLKSTESISHLYDHKVCENLDLMYNMLKLHECNYM